MIISMIAAVDERGGLGKDNALLWHLPADLQHFKRLTIERPILMGRSTFDSIGRALPGRLNVVLSRRAFQAEGIVVVGSLEQALAVVADAPEIAIIGGASVYEQALPLVHRLYLTVVHHTFEADVFFPVINPPEWICVEETARPCDDNNAYDMTFYEYQRVTP